MLRPRAIALGIVATVGTSLGLTATASAHNINLVSTRAQIRKYVQGVVDDPKQTPFYEQARPSCRLQFRGHSHFAICKIIYETATDVNACQERIQAYIQIRGSGIDAPFAQTGIFMKHITKPCGRFRLNSTVKSSIAFTPIASNNC